MCIMMVDVQRFVHYVERVSAATSCSVMYRLYEFYVPELSQQRWQRQTE
jgi:hypothetical protein